LVEKIKSGIPGLDELTYGGIPKGSNILVSGGTGTGKTIFCTQFLYNGAIESGDPGLFVTLEGNIRDISWNMESFRWDIKKLQDEKMLTIYRLNLSAVDDLDIVQKRVDEQLDEISKEVEEIGAKRLVVDSTTVFGAYFNPSILRTTLFQFADRLKTLGCTTFLTSETAPSKNVLSAYGVEEFLVDGIFSLNFTPPNRSIFIRKLRGTDHDKNPHPITINSNGFSINPKDSMLWEAIK
jgi:circadian clock protein KaiC